MSLLTRVPVILGSVALVATGLARAASAQQLAPKRTLAAAAPTGCAALAPVQVPVSASPLGDDTETRRLISSGQEAALAGEHAAARDAFLQASQRNPNHAMVAYYLGLEYEALGSSTDAVREYCRYLQLSPAARDGDEVRGRIVRLVPVTELAAIDEAKANFSSGVALLERRQFIAADSMFGSIAQRLPNTPEIYYNRGLARAARGERALATEDFEKYLELSSNPPDRLAIRSAVSRLQDRVFGTGQALGSGILIPGMGQMSTGRPVLGVAVLGAVAGAMVWGLAREDGFEVKTFEDPFGTPYVDSIPRTTRPNVAIAAAAAGLLWFGSAFEAMTYARRTRARAESIIQIGTPVGDDTQAYMALGRGTFTAGVSVRLKQE
jgi:tetratricopeptide (TPR) repeat protein